jgi:hypothetical protein
MFPLNFTITDTPKYYIIWTKEKHLLIKTREKPFLWRAMLVVSSSKYLATRFGCLQASHDFLHSVAETCCGE